MTAKAQRIAVLLQSLEGGGAQRRVVDLVNGFVRCGREVDLFLIDDAGKLRERLAPQVRLLDAKDMPARLRSDPPDALLSGAAAVNPIAVAAVPAQRGFPLVLRASSAPYRSFPWSMPRRRLGEPLRRRKRINAYAAADLIIAVANSVAEPLRRAFPDTEIVVIRNQVVTDAFLAGAAASVELPWPDDPAVPLIVAIGRIAIAKDFPTLLRAFALVRQRREVRLAILGGGSAARARRLLGLAKRLGVERDVALLGDTDDVAAWLTRAQLLVSSSIWEGAPSVIVEALAMGRPVVATEIDGSAREVITDPALGSVVPPRDLQAMARAISEWLDRAADPQRLKAAAEPYRTDPSEEYLRAIDACAQRFARQRGAGSR